ncbi:MAG: hypothetical protein H0T89_33110 [Deltaproteobacteria bacterium]|nr:hypothetical protein [Deltaproteobacteria bacterium]MDQ3298976.1 hypothetical protein [Myxococcota bacterium]
MQRWGLLAIVVAGCEAPAPTFTLGEPPSEPADVATLAAAAVQLHLVHQPPAQRFLAMHAGTWELDFDPALGTLRSLRGSGFELPDATTEAALEAAARGFVAEHADLFGSAELVAELVNDGVVMDRPRALASIMFAQRHRGLPVIGGHLGLTVSHGRLVLVQGAMFPVGDVATTPAIGRAAAAAVVRVVVTAPRRGDHDTARLVILPERSPDRVHYRLAWEVTAWRGERQAVVFVDARDGELVSGHDANRYDYGGRATNHVDERTVGDAVIELPAAHLRLRSARGATITDATGAFAFRGEAGPLIVNANLHGAYVDVLNLAGPNATFVGMMRPEAPYALEWTETRSTPEERDVFRAVNTTNRFVATVFPDLPWMQHAVVANVNRPHTCNAYWNGSSINFFIAGNGCNNTGRIFDVVAHEWGHGFDAHAPGAAIDGALGEFIGDLMSFVQTKSPLLAPGFFTNGKPVRDLEDPAFECFDPKKKEVHAAGHLLGAVVWDIFTDLERTGFTGEPLKRLMLRPIAIAQTRRQWYGAMLAVDDDDGNLANGTPHECLIYNQFKAHSCGGTRWPGIPAKDPPHCAAAVVPRSR